MSDHGQRACWTLQESVPSDGFECYYILKEGLQVAEVSGPQNVENTTNLQELVSAANRSRSPAVKAPEKLECEMCAGSKWKSACPECDGTGFYTPDSPCEYCGAVAGHNEVCVMNEVLTLRAQVERQARALHYIAASRWNENADLDDICTQADKALALSSTERRG